MKPEPIFSDTNRPMNVALFVSGSGTNARKIIEKSLQMDSRYKIILIFTDIKDNRTKKNSNKMCYAKDIANEFGIAYEAVDIRDFYKKRGLKRTDLSIRPDFDKLVIQKIEKYPIDIIALAGYMSITTKPILTKYSGKIINVHPADLSIIEGKERKYVGIHTVKDAILEGESELRATTHIVREKVDHGEILVISKPIPIVLPPMVTIDDFGKDKKLLKKVVNEHQTQLKEKGDWQIFPITIQMIAEGRFALEGEKVYLDGVKQPSGYKLK